MTLLDLDRVTVGFAEGLALRELSLTLAPGERIGLVGESGSGKTMAGLAMMGMLPPQARLSGAVRFEGHRIDGLPEAALARLRGRAVAMVFQEPMTALNPLQTIGRQIAEPLLWHRLATAREARARVLDLLREVDMPEPEARLAQYPHQLSGGQRQRAMIAMALSCGPRLLIADEPTTALDPDHARQVLDLIARLCRKRGMALVLISHDLAAVERTADRLVVLYGGDRVEDGPVARVLRAPAHPYTIGLTAARPVLRLSGPRQMLPTVPGTVPPLGAMPPGCRFHGRCRIGEPACTRAVPALRPVAEEHAVACLKPQPPR